MMMKVLGIWWKFSIDFLGFERVSSIWWFLKNVYMKNSVSHPIILTMCTVKNQCLSLLAFYFAEGWKLVFPSAKL
jgi:hypothetical protein